MASQKRSLKEALAFVGPSICAFCRRPFGEDDCIKFGPKESRGKMSTHYYCMLLSSNLVQDVEEDDPKGIMGFSMKSIKRELFRGSKVNCAYCSKKGATVGCCVRQCRRTFHFTCGFENEANANFNSRTFEVLCSEHKVRQTLEPKPMEDGAHICLVCYEPLDLEKVREDLIVSPCCLRTYEKDCLRRYAVSSGSHHFRCCNCRNHDDFQNTCRENGIFIPVKDAEWELENAFADHYEVPNKCCMVVCFRMEGRDGVDDDDDWEVVRCDLCGTNGTHIKCGNLKDGAMSDFICDDCKVADDDKENEKPNSHHFKASTIFKGEEVAVFSKSDEVEDDDLLDVDAVSDQEENAPIRVSPLRCEGNLATSIEPDHEQQSLGPRPSTSEKLSGSDPQRSPTDKLKPGVLPKKKQRPKTKISPPRRLKKEAKSVPSSQMTILGCPQVAKGCLCEICRSCTGRFLYWNYRPEDDDSSGPSTSDQTRLSNGNEGPSK